MPLAAAMSAVRRSLFAAAPAGPRHYPAISPRVRASFALRRLALENAHARAAGDNRRTSDDVRHPA
jgi:hypothetical protein